MSSCITPEMRKEVASNEYKRLANLKRQGYEADSENGIENIVDAMKDMRTIYQTAKKPKVSNQDMQVREEVNEVTINALNKEQPKLDGKAPIEILKTYKYADGTSKSIVRYKNSKKEYTFDTSRIWTNQMSTKQLGNEYGESLKDTSKHEELEKDMYKDPDKMLNLFDELEAIDGGKTEYTDNMRELLTKVVDGTKPILNEFSIHINKEAERNQGAAVLYSKNAKSKLILNVNTSSDLVEGEMSAVETYLHEIIHLSVEAAVEFKSNKLSPITEELGLLWSQAKKDITPDMLMDGNGKEAKERAQRKWDYMFNNSEGNGLKEFAAYGRTNAKMMKLLSNVKLKRTTRKLKSNSLFDHLAYLIGTLYDALKDLFVKNREDMKGDERLQWLVAQMWDKNNQALKDTSFWDKSVNVTRKTSKLLNEKAATGIVKTAKVVDNVYMGLADTLPKNLQGIAKLPRHMLAWGLNPWISEEEIKQRTIATQELSVLLDSIGLGWIFAPQGSFMSMLNFISPDDKLKTKIEKFGLMSKKLDSTRADKIVAVAKRIKDGLKGVSRKHQKYLTEVLIEMDVKSLLTKYNLKDIQGMLQDTKLVESNIEEEYKELDKLVQDVNISNYYKSQSIGLGRSLVTGITGSSQQTNIYDLVALTGTGFDNTDIVTRKWEDTKKITKIIDRLATLHALKYDTNTKRKEVISNLIDTHPNAVSTSLSFHQAYEDKIAQYNADNRLHQPHVKGSIKDLLPNYVTTKVADNSKETQKYLKKYGYKIKGKAGVEGQYLYVSTFDALAPYEKQATSKINLYKQMHTLVHSETTANLAVGNKVDLANQELKEKELEDKAKLEIRRQFAGIVEPKVDGYTMQVGFGKRTTYGISIGKDLYSDATKADKTIPKLLGAMIAEADERVSGTELNKRVMKEAWNDMAKNYKRKDMKNGKWREYIEIGPDAQFMKGHKRSEEYSKRVWKNMPQNVKQEILDRGEGHQYIAVRVDLTDMYFGTRAPSILDTKIPKMFGGKTIDERLREKDLDALVNGVKFAGELWEEVIRLYKKDVVIKLPETVLDNILSNINYSWMMGQFIWDTVEQHIRMFTNTKKYLDMKDKALALDVKIASMSGKNRRDMLIKKKELIELMKINPVHPLMEAGLFTTIAEDLQGVETNAKGRIDQLTEGFKNKVPKIIKDVGSMLYLTEDTQLFKFMQTAVTYSDFVARANRYHYLIDVEKLTHSQAIKQILDEFNNYGRHISDTFNWLDKMSPIQFHRYILGANKNLATRLKTNPLNIASMWLSDYVNPTDATWGKKDLSYTINTPSETIDNITEHVLTPATLRQLGIL